MRVSSRLDWNRHGMWGHNLEASALLCAVVLGRSVELGEWVSGEEGEEGKREWTQRSCVGGWKGGVEQLYCSDTGLYLR